MFPFTTVTIGSGTGWADSAARAFRGQCSPGYWPLPTAPRCGRGHDARRTIRDVALPLPVGSALLSRHHVRKQRHLLGRTRVRHGQRLRQSDRQLLVPELAEKSGFTERGEHFPDHGPRDRRRDDVDDHGHESGSATMVEFGGTAATIVSDTATQIVAVSPAESAAPLREGSHGDRDLSRLARATSSPTCPRPQ